MLGLITDKPKSAVGQNVCVAGVPDLLVYHEPSRLTVSGYQID
jgi:hypothetical protein